jgi:hypothetical protein
MENNEFAKKLEERTRSFEITIIKFSGSLPGNAEPKIVRNLTLFLSNLIDYLQSSLQLEKIYKPL